MDSNNKLFIGNLPFKATDKQLEDLFSGAGEVMSAMVITDRQTGRSRGFGFVQMKTADGVQKAIEMFHGKDFEGRNLVVNEARPRENE